jgi:hypothetical protein
MDCSRLRLIFVHMLICIEMSAMKINARLKPSEAFNELSFVHKLDLLDLRIYDRLK